MATILTSEPLADIHSAPAPPVPTTLAEAGLSADLVEHLLVKTLYTGEATGLVVADRMRLPFGCWSRSSSTRAPSGSSRCGAPPARAQRRVTGTP